MRANLPIGYTFAASQPNGNWFARLAVATSRISGRPTTFLLAVAVVLMWAITGPLFGFSDTWQLVINTGTTIVTFLMVFLIQATQNRDTLALQLKLDELTMATKNARNHIAASRILRTKRSEKQRSICSNAPDELWRTRAVAAARPPSAAPRWHRLRTPPSGGKAAGHRSGCWAHPFRAIGRFRAANFSTLEEAA